ncbi:MAG: hypothetical protein M3440_01320, partial [Chloroflexota bacterium]|nr:hypothetical protein [Chloroflexota bacterium]
MRQGRSFDIERSNVVQRQISRSGNGGSSWLSRPGLHRTLMVTAFLIIGLIGSSGVASAGPLLIAMEDSGGGGAI